MHIMQHIHVHLKSKLRWELCTCLIATEHWGERNVIKSQISSFGTAESNFKNNLQKYPSIVRL